MQLASGHPDLVVRTAGRSFDCCGGMVERGDRPGSLKDAWMVGHSKHCQGVIASGQLYLWNRLLSPDMLRLLEEQPTTMFRRVWPTCVACAMVFPIDQLVKGSGWMDTTATVGPSTSYLATDTTTSPS